MILKEKQYHTTSVLTFLSGMSIPKIKLVYAAGFWAASIPAGIMNPHGTYSVPNDLKTIAVFPLLYSREDNRPVSIPGFQ